MSPRLASLCLCALASFSVVSASAQDIDPSTGSAIPYAGTPVTGYKLAWSDEFNAGALDSEKWNYRLDTRYWSLQRAENVRVGEGVLYLDLKKETFGTTSYTAGGVISKKLFRYGYYEAAMKVPPGAGWHTSFWMMKANRPATDTVAIELDAIENDSITPLKYGVNTHRHLPTPHVTFGSKSVVTPSLSAGFHVVGCEFTPTVVRYFFEGAVVQTVVASQFPHNDLNIWLTSIAAPLGGTPSVDDSQLPAAALFDYVRFFAPKATASVNITSPGSFGVTLASTAHSLRLSANATSSDPALTPVIEWSKYSGPGNVTFSDAHALSTAATFSAPGTYLLQCQASVDGNPTTARVPIAVDAPLAALFRQSFDGYSHTATFIRGDSTSWNSGARDQMLVGRNNGRGMRLLLAFPLEGLPADSAIEDASLELWTSTTLGTGTVGPLELRPLLAPPTEGAGTGASATDGAGTGATWLSRTGGNATADLWASPGGDFGSQVLATAPGFDAAIANRPVTFSGSTSLTALAEDARLTALPLKLLVISPSTEAGVVNALTRIHSDDSPDSDYRPLLTVYYRGNYAPEPSAGPPPAAVAGSPVALAGTAARANSARWTQLSGPASAAFADANLAATSVTFPAPGNYTLELSAANPLAETFATLVVPVAPAPSAIEQWRTTHFGGPANSGDGEDAADPDKDGLVNLMEFATGSHPKTSNGPAGSVAIPGSSLEFTYPRSHAATAAGCLFTVEWSDTLGSDWSDSGVTQSAVPGTDNGVTSLWRATVPAGFPTRRFVRLRVQLP